MTGEAVTVHVGGKEYAIPPLSAGRGLEAAQMFIPYLILLRPAIEKIAADRAAGREDERSLTEIGMDVGMTILPEIKAADILRLAHLLTGIPLEEISEAPLPDMIQAIIAAVKAVDLGNIVGTANRLINLAGLGANAPAGAEVPAEPERMEG